MTTLSACALAALLALMYVVGFVAGWRFRDARIPFRTDCGFGQALYERSGDVLLYVHPETREAA